MRQKLTLILLIVIWCLPGCRSMEMISSSSDDLVESQETYRTAYQELVRQELRKGRRGSLVRMIVDGNRRLLGTLHSANPDHVELTNCLARETIHCPNGQDFCQTSHIPFLSVDTSNITTIYAISPPPAEVPSEKKGDHPDSADFTVDEIVLMSDRVQKWGEPTKRDGSDRDARTSEEVREEIITTPCGTQVSIVDEFGCQFCGTVVSTSQETLELMNCVWKEIIPDRKGATQFKTNHLPLKTFPTASITSVGIISPAPSDYVVPQIGEDCEEYCVAEFVLSNGERLRWETPAE